MADQYPRGKLNDDDEGAFELAIGTKDKTVIIDFGKPVVWIGLDGPLAEDFAGKVLRHARSLSGTTPAQIVKELNHRQCMAILIDERAIEELHHRDRDEIISMGLAYRAWPHPAGLPIEWRTWLTPLGLDVRKFLDEMMRAKGKAPEPCPTPTSSDTTESTSRQASESASPSTREIED